MVKTKAEIDSIKRQVAAYEEYLRKEKCEKRLRDFLKYSWPIIEPSAVFIPGKHIDAICEHLQAVEEGQIRKLIINIAPRSSKSTQCAIAFPAWTWTRNPGKSFLFASYDLKLSMRDSRKCRMLIGSDWYQKQWSERFRILTNKGGQDTKQRFDNNMGGYRIATSTDAGTTGEGGHIAILDDPNDIGQMNSEAYIEQVIYYFDHVLSTRSKDPKTDAKIVIQQRCSERDLTGHILEKEHGWDHLVIPMEYEGSRTVTSIGWSDWRTTPGELMCPERFGPEELAEHKKKPILYNGQFQQRPAPGEGAKFKRTWWKFWNPRGVTPKDEAGNPIPVRIKIPGGDTFEIMPVEIPVAFEQVVQGWDMSFGTISETASDVVGHAYGRVGANTYLLARDAKQRDFPDTLKAVRDMSRHDRFPCPEKMVESKANGMAVIQTLRNEIPGMIPSPVDASGLEGLANSMTGYVEAGNIFLPNPNLFPWVSDVIEQFAVFPNGKHDDDIAAACHAWRRLYDSVANCAAPEFRVAPRAGEIENACHVKSDDDMMAELPPHWRRWIAIAPGAVGAALWFCETPRGSLRVYRELELPGVDAFEAGRLIAEATLPDIRAYQSAVHLAAKWNMTLMLEKSCFAAIEPVGSYAELLEDGILSYEPLEGDFDYRERVKKELRLAKFTSDMAELEDSTWEHLRDFLRFAPPDFKELDYDRELAIELSRSDMAAYRRYMAAVEGRIDGEWPKIKFAASCKHTAAALGSARRTEDSTDPFIRALLVGISAPPPVTASKGPREIPWTPKAQIQARRVHKQRMLRRAR